MPLRTMEDDEDGAKPPPLPSTSVLHHDGLAGKAGALPMMNPMAASMLNPMAAMMMNPMGKMSPMALRNFSHPVTSDAVMTGDKVVGGASGPRSIEDSGDEDIVFFKAVGTEEGPLDIEDADDGATAGDKEVGAVSGPPGVKEPSKLGTSDVSELVASEPPQVPGTIRYSNRTSLKKPGQNGGVDGGGGGGRNTNTMRMTWRNQRQQQQVSFLDDQTAASDLTLLHPGAVRVGDNESDMGTVQVGGSVNLTSNCHLNHHGEGNEERHYTGHDLNQGSEDEDRPAIGQGVGEIGPTPEQRSSSLNSIPLLEAEVASDPVMAESVHKVAQNHNRRNKLLGACFICLSLLVVAVVTGINIWKKKQESNKAFHSVEKQDVVVIRFEELTVVIQLDGKPEETGWSLSCGDSFEESEIGFAPGVYEGRAFELVVNTDQIAYEGECTFTIVDEGGDGIEGGYFEIYEGDDITDPEAKIIEGSGFTDSMTVTFSLDSPTPSASPTDAISQTPSINPTEQPSMEPTPAPTLKPTYRPSPLPTVSPTDLPTPSPTPPPSLSPTPPPTPIPTRPPSPPPTESPTPPPTQPPTPPPTQPPTPAPSQPPSTPPTPPPTLSPTCPVVPQGLEFLVTQSITILRRDGLCLSEQDLVVLEDGLAEGYNTQHQSLFDTCSAYYRYIVSSVAGRSVLLRCQERKLVPDDKGGNSVVSRTDDDLSRRLRAMAAVPFGMQIRCTPDAVQCSHEDFVDTRDAMIGVLEESGTYIILGFDYELPTPSPSLPPTLVPTTPPTTRPSTSPTTPPTTRPSTPPTTRPTASPTPRPTTTPTTLPTTPPTPRPSTPPTTPPTCLGASEFYGGSYKTEQGGEDESHTIECGGETDIAVMVVGEGGCNFNCVGSLTQDDYEDVCDHDDILEFMLEGDHRGSTLNIGYLDDIYEASVLDCSEDIIILNSSEDDDMGVSMPDDDDTGVSMPSNKNNPKNNINGRRVKRNPNGRRVKSNPNGRRAKNSNL